MPVKLSGTGLLIFRSFLNYQIKLIASNLSVQTSISSNFIFGRLYMSKSLSTYFGLSNWSYKNKSWKSFHRAANHMCVGILKSKEGHFIYIFSWVIWWHLFSPPVHLKESWKISCIAADPGPGNGIWKEPEAFSVIKTELSNSFLLCSGYPSSEYPWSLTYEQRHGGQSRREGREKEGKKGERRRGKEGGFIGDCFPILFIQIYPSPIPNNAGNIDEIMVTLTLRVVQKIFCCFEILLAKQ